MLHSKKMSAYDDQGKRDWQYIHNDFVVLRDIAGIQYRRHMLSDSESEGTSFLEVAI